MANVLAVVAHPDDESFWMGAALAQDAAAGDKVAVLALSDGVGSRARGDAPSRRLDHFREACAVLGAEPLAHWVFPDQESDTVPQLTINRAVETYLAKLAPSVVYTHHVGDLNLDHRRVAEAVLVATRSKPIRVLTCRPEWPTRCVGPSWKPNLSWEVFPPELLERKIAACLCYRDEIREFPHPRSERAVRESAEAFMVIR